MYLILPAFISIDIFSGNHDNFFFLVCGNYIQPQKIIISINKVCITYDIFPCLPDFILL